MQNNAANANTPAYVFATHPYTSSTATYQQQWTSNAPDDMEIRIPRSNESNGKIFGRLHVTQP